MLGGVDFYAESRFAKPQESAAKPLNALAVFQTYRCDTHDKTFAADFNKRLRVTL